MSFRSLRPLRSLAAASLFLTVGAGCSGGGIPGLGGLGGAPVADYSNGQPANYQEGAGRSAGSQVGQMVGQEALKKTPLVGGVVGQQVGGAVGGWITKPKTETPATAGGQPADGQ